MIGHFFELLTHQIIGIIRPTLYRNQKIKLILLKEKKTLDPNIRMTRTRKWNKQCKLDAKKGKVKKAIQWKNRYCECHVKYKKHGSAYKCQYYTPKSFLVDGSDCGGFSTVAPPLLTSAAGVRVEPNAGLQFADTGIVAAIASDVDVAGKTETETQFSEPEQFDLANCIMEGGYQEETEEVDCDQEVLTSPKET